MKKTISINISGLIFTIDEDAYQRLSQYLESIRNHFSTIEGHDDIIADIESRIAELLQRKITDQKQVVCISDINEIIVALGQPFEMDDEQAKDQKNQSTSGPSRPKRLFRDPDNKKLGGVAAGLAAYFAIEALWIRIIFVVLFLTSGVGLFIYIALWIFIPEAFTTAEKLEMRGEPVNVATIEQSIKQEFESVKGNFNTYASNAKEGFNRTGRKAGQAASRLNDPVLQVIRGIARFFGVLFGLLFFALGTLLILVLGSLFLGWDEFGIFADVELPFLGGEQLYNLLLAGPLSVAIAPVAFGAFIAIPLIMLVYAGLRLMIGEHFKIPGLGNIATGLWIASVVGLFYIGTTLIVDMKEMYFSEDQPKYFDNDKYKVLYFSATDVRGENEDENLAFFDQRYYLKEKDAGKEISGSPYFYFEPTKGQSAFLETTRMARGKTNDKARERAAGIKYPLIMSDSSLVVPNYFSFDAVTKIRNQRMTLRVNLPEGQLVSLDNSMKSVVSETMRYRMRERSDTGNLWVMTSDGLHPFLSTVK
jgi:phage shock protein PspC (stress-responsive transcriptional regulator)